MSIEHVKDNREDLVNAFLMTTAVARLIPRSEVATTSQGKEGFGCRMGEAQKQGCLGRVASKRMQDSYC